MSESCVLCTFTHPVGGATSRVSNLGWSWTANVNVQVRELSRVPL